MQYFFKLHNYQKQCIFMHSWPNFRQKKIISNYPAMSLSSSYQQSISCKIPKISNESILRKLHKYGKRGNFGYYRSNFWANKNFPKLACYVSLNYLSTINFMQNINKM